MSIQWYKTNFSKDVLVKGQKTVFLRIENIKENENLWVCPIPIPINNDIAEEDPFSINYVKTKSLFDFLTSSTPSKITEDLNLFNLIGHPESSGLEGFKFPSDLNVWRKIEFGEKTDFRLDYSAEKNSILKIVFLFTNISPNDFSTTLPRYFVDSYPSPVVLGDVIKTSGSPEIFEVFDGTNFVYIDYPSLGIKNIHTIKNSSNENLYYETTNLFDFQEVYIFGYEKDENEFSKNLGNNASAEIYDRPIFEDLHSFSLLRTNPKLSGNIKVTIDSKNDIWLNTIDANETLSNSKFKKFKISPDSSFPADLRSFLDDGSVTSEILFDLNETSYDNTKKTFKEQYDFFYGYGVQDLKSEFYDEDHSFFAPLWLRKELPDFFILLKLPHSINEETFSTYTKKEIAEKYLKESQIIKTYDLKKGTKIGTYLRNIVESSRFKEMPLTVNYDKNEFTTWSGIDFKKGIFSDKVELFYDNYVNDLTIKEFEDLVTKGFERNNLICANLINLEFLFDDEFSEDYEINRYFGFYVNEIELSSFKLNKEALKVISNQEPDPIPGKDGEEYSMQSFIQTNENGIIFPVGELISGKLPLSNHVNDETRFFVLHNKNNELSKIKSLNNYTNSYENSSSYQNFVGLELFEKEIDFAEYLGITKLSYQIPATFLKKSQSQLVIEVTDEILDGEKFKISWVSINEDFIWEITANSNGLNPGEWWDYPVFDYSDKKYKNTFSNEGNVNYIATAIAGAFNEFENKKFTALAKENKVILISNEKSIDTNSLTFERTLVLDSYVNSINFFGIAAICNQVYYEEENTANVSFSSLDECPLKISSYTVEFSNCNIGTPASGIVKVFAYTNNNEIVFNNYVEIGDSFSFGNLLVYTDIATTNGILKINVSNLIQSQNFIGGSSTDDNIAKIFTKDIVNIKTDDWFQTKRGTYKKLTSFLVQDTELLHLYFINDPIIENGNIIDFNDIDDYSLIFIEDESFLTNADKKIIAYKTYDTKLSLLSFLNIKDFDFDFLKSDYSYIPIGELVRFFEDYENGFILSAVDDEKEIKVNDFFMIQSENLSSVELYGYDTTWTLLKTFDANLSESIVPQFNTLNENVIYDQSDVSLFYPRIFNFNSNSFTKIKVKLKSGSKVKIIKTLFWQDVDLNTFKGFTGLHDFYGTKDEERLEKLNENRDFNRFLFKLLKSEYDRLGENNLIETAFTSKVVPNILKWVNQGKDIRDNKYRLNTSSAFGYTNFSPDFSITIPDSTSLTHEWFYLDEIPEGFDEEFISNSRSYFFQDLNTSPVTNILDENFGKTWYELFKQTDVDWFFKYFTIGYPSEVYKESNVIKGVEERFSFIKYNKLLDESYIIFRGIKIKFQDLDPKTKQKINFSTRYDNYKFSVITRKLEKPLYENNKPFEIEIIDNRKFNFIVIIISVYYDDYKSSKNLDYTSLYSTKSSIRNIQLFDGSVPQVSFDGDFWTNYFLNENSRHFGEFRGAPILDFSDINTYAKFDTIFLYSYYEEGVSSPSYDYHVKIPINTELAVQYGILVEKEIKDVRGQLNNNLNKDKEDLWMMHFYSFGDSTPFLGTYYQTIPSYFEDFNISSLHIFGNNWPSSALNKKPINSIRPFSNSLNGKVINEDGIYYLLISNESSTDDSIFYNFGSIDFNPNAFGEYNSYIPIPTNTSEVFYLNGGENYNDQILSKLSFANLMNEINSENAIFIEIDDDVIYSKNYSLEFIEYDKIIKVTTKMLELDTDKPIEYKDTEKIGFKTRNVNLSDVIYRHKGTFEPRTKNVIKFWVREDNDFTSYFEKDFLLCNTKILIEDENIGTISNLFFNKVADNEILKISRSSSYESKYSLIDEISIDKKDFFIFNSNWDNEYFSKYSNKKTFSLKEGLEELNEQKSFFGSKVMILPKAFDIHEFNDNEVSYSVSLLSNDALEIKTLLNETAIKNYPLTENGSKPSLDITINVKERLLRFMLENGAMNEFLWIKSQNVSKLKTLSDDEIKVIAKTYLENNIIELFKISQVLLYVLEDIDENDIQLLDYSLTEAEQLQLGYRKDKNFKVENIDDLNVKIKKTLDSKKRNSYSIGIVLNRI